MKQENKPKLCIVTETYAPEINGVANTLFQVIKRLPAEDRIQLVRPRLGNGQSTPTQANLSVLELPSAPIPKYPELRFGLPASRRLEKWWRADRPQAIYVATQGPLGWSAVRTAQRLGIPVCSGFHTNFHSYSAYYGWGWLQKLITAYFRYFHRKTRLTLAPTVETAQQLSQLGINNAQVWSRGVDCELFNPSRRRNDLRAQWGVSEGQAVFLYVGRIAAEKNIELALRAYKRAKSAEPSARMVLVGDGPMAKHLAEQNPDLIFAGTQTGETLASYYASADIFLFPSLTDTFGNVVVEAMASGLALVCFDQAAAKEHLVHEVSGLLAQPNDPDEYCRHAISLAIRPRLQERLSKASLSKAHTLHWPRLVMEFQNHLLNTRCEVTAHELFPSQSSVSSS